MMCSEMRGEGQTRPPSLLSPLPQLPFSDHILSHLWHCLDVSSVSLDGQLAVQEGCCSFPNRSRSFPARSAASARGSSDDITMLAVTR